MSQDMEKMIRIPPPRIQEVAKALSGDLRLRILEALGDKPMSVTQLMEALGVAQPTVSINVQILEQAGLITSSQGSNREKLCSRSCDSLLFNLPKALGESLHDIEEINMPIGLYTDCSIAPPCGLVGKEGIIGSPDDPRSFYLPERSEATLLWFSNSGYVEYRFPNPMPPGVGLKALRISAELCSEAAGYKEDWPSDITLFVNGLRIGTVNCPGDFGEIKGNLTPNWWVGGTQYGNLYEWQIETSKSISDRLESSVTLQDLDLHFNRPITIRFEVEQNATNCGGMNLFGSTFGNYPQDIKLTFIRE
jgi:predicted transcriptional regulator